MYMINNDASLKSINADMNLSQALYATTTLIDESMRRCYREYSAPSTLAPTTSAMASRKCHVHREPLMGDKMIDISRHHGRHVGPALADASA